MILYPIDRDSPPRTGTKTRTDLAALNDLVGIGIVFPGEPDRSGDYYSVTIDAPTPEQLDEEEVVDEQSVNAGELAHA